MIEVGPEFYLILDQNDQAISFSILYDLLLYLSQHAIPFPLRRSLDHFFRHSYLTPLPLSRTFCTVLTALQPTSSLRTTNILSHIGRTLASPPKNEKAQAHCTNHTNRFNLTNHAINFRIRTYRLHNSTNRNPKETT